jgi:hypothetical protein
MALLNVEEVSLEKVEELVKYTHKRVEMAEKVLKDPSDENLIEYNHIVEIHGELRRDLCIYPKLTEAEKAASAIWMTRRDDIDWW